MKSKLTPPEVELLHTRIYIAQHTHLFKLEDLSLGWDISQSTLFRYEYPVYREISRVSSRKKTELERGIDKSKCQICTDPLKGHERCPSCTMLIHGEPECHCIESFIRRQLQHNQ